MKTAGGHDQHHLSYLHVTPPKCDLKQLQDLQGNEECQWCQLLHWSERCPWHDWDLELQVPPPMLVITSHYSTQNQQSEKQEKNKKNMPLQKKMVFRHSWNQKGYWA